MPEPSRALAQVALPVGLRRVFTYAVPASLRPLLRAGHRVRVPFGRTESFGYVVGFTSEKPDFALKEIRAIEPEAVLLTPEILRLTRWAADYYLAPWGQVAEAALPPSVREGTRPRARRRRTAEAGADGDSSQEPPIVLSQEQRRSADAVTAAIVAGGYAAFLLLGVTGSGKTEIYLEAAERVVADGGGVLFLVPEIAMGTQIVARVARRFAGRVGLFHSQTGEARRREVWEGARDGRIPVVVGTRSAVFVPMPRLRLVVVDEEHEWAYKQDEAPRYHGRDLAVVRARHAGAVVLLGSATPSLESLWNAERGKYALLRLPDRPEGRTAARVTVVDLKEAWGTDGDGPAGRPRRPPSLLSPVLVRAVQDRLDAGEQSILFLNRRGHSPIVQCSDCGLSIQCRHCDVTMTWHKAGGHLRCHYCNAIRRDVDVCEGCRGTRFFFGGSGTQKLEEEIAATFPDARIARMDFDAVRRRGAHGRLVSAMEQGELDILLGTQMVAKGFHFPRVTLVGVLRADQEIQRPDFRAPERAFQILTQVAGRAGRGGIAGEVVFQSMLPDHPVVACTVTGDYEGFALREMEDRRALQYPPFHRMIDLLIDGPVEDQVRRRAEAVRDRVAGALPKGVEILGPAPSVHARLKGRFRWHLTLKGPSSDSLHALVQSVLEAEVPVGLSRTRIQVDVDPLGNV